MAPRPIPRICGINFNFIFCQCSARFGTEIVSVQLEWKAFCQCTARIEFQCVQIVGLSELQNFSVLKSWVLDLGSFRISESVRIPVFIGFLILNMPL